MNEQKEVTNMPVQKTRVNKAKKKTEDPGRRFAEPFASFVWHPDGTAFSAQDYRDAGMTPPTQRQLRALLDDVNVDEKA